MTQPKAIIIEFVGPPGAGKTTNCQHFVSELKTKNQNTYIFQDLRLFLHELPLHKKLVLIARTLLLKSKILYQFTLTLFQHGIYSMNSIYRYFKLMVYNEVLTEFIKAKKVDFLLLDQWVIQGIWSSTIFNMKPFDTDKLNLNRYYFQTNFVLYFDIDPKTASSRIANRATNLSRFDRMSAIKRHDKLLRYNAYLYQLFENSNCEHKYIFSTEYSPATNAELFMNYIEPSIN
jgi:hypothetical protein